MKELTFPTKIKTILSNISLKGWLIGGGVTLVVVSLAVFFIPKTVHFSYAGDSCVGHLTVAPGLQKFHSAEFNATFENTLTIGGVAIASTKLCVEPTQAPKTGAYTAYLGPFGNWVAAKQFIIQAPEAPTARAADLVGKAISTSQPLKIQLTSEDVIHQYNLKIAEKKTECEQVNDELSCDVTRLELEHGAKYTAALHQVYKEVDKKIIEGTLETLQPLVLTQSSVTDSQTIYDKPTSFTFTFDREVTGGKVALAKIVNNATEEVEVSQEVDGKSLTLRFAELDRETLYRLELGQAIGNNGSSLAAPVIMNFKTAGGPKVASVSIGAHSVGRNATAIVTFDQPIDASLDIAKYAHIQGTGATIKKRSDTQLAFTLQGGDCTAFSLVIDKGLKSGSSGAESKEGWKFDSRTVCGYSWSIGKSVQGRSITAYSFGSGAKTILFTGGMHGSEPSGYTTMMAWVKHLQAYGDIIPADKRVVIVPNTNPDGIAANSRYNSRDVNIDRNFPTANWQASIETSRGTLPTGGGTSAGSEPETAALVALTRQLRPRLELSYHAQGRLVGANKFADSVAIGNIYASTVGYKTMYYNAEDVMGYAMTGEYEDWMGESMNIPAILIELPSASGNYLNSQLNALKKMLAV